METALPVHRVEDKLPPLKIRHTNIYTVMNGGGNEITSFHAQI